MSLSSSHSTFARINHTSSDRVWPLYEHSSWEQWHSGINWSCRRPNLNEDLDNTLLGLARIDALCETGIDRPWESLVKPTDSSWKAINHCPAINHYTLGQLLSFFKKGCLCMRSCGAIGYCWLLNVPVNMLVGPDKRTARSNLTADQPISWVKWLGVCWVLTVLVLWIDIHANLWLFILVTPFCRRF